jgi:hypothetical protein
MEAVFHKHISEGTMRAMTAVLVAVSLTAVPLRADEVVRTCAKMEAYRQFNIPRFERAQLESLRFRVPAVVECALREVALLKLAQPTTSSSAIYDQVCDLAENGTTPAIQYKASLVRMLYDHPDMFVSEGMREYVNDEEVFTALSDRLQKSVLAIVIR